MKRRSFIAIFLSCLLGNPAFCQLQWPVIGSQTRPWTRWWWMGSAVNKKDLKESLEKYRSAGLGGLELTPIYGVKGYEDQFIPYLSPKWMEMLSFTLQESRRLGLGLDMSAGTGWPFGGGPLIGEDDACKEFFAKTWTVKGSESLQDTVRFIQEPLVHTDGFPKPAIGDLVSPVFANKNLQALALFQVRFAKPLPLQALMAYSADGRIMDLTDKVSTAGILQWTAPAGADWILYGVFEGLHGKMVERAAPGAEGNVIDHFSPAALKKYLSRFDTAFAGHDLGGLRAFFNDSYEVDDSRGQSNWTPGFFELFHQYRGYDLRQHLPALLGKDSKENNDRVICDFRETISDLLLDKFTQGWRAWAQGKGAIIRNQAHGSPANILDLYAASDIPETEGSDVYRYKFAVSAANVTGKKLASSESVTWLNEHFLSTWSDVKTAVDGYLLGGVNHIFYHGTAYTPKNDPWPGWLFYASVHFTPNDPSWPNFSTLNNYIARAQSFLQQGSPDNDVLLYYPIYDSWSGPGRDLLKHYDRMEPEFNGTGFKECAETMQRHGYAYDYISDKQLQQAFPAAAGSSTSAPSADGLAPAKGSTAASAISIRTSGGVSYQTVLLPDCHYISETAFQQLIRLAESGANIIVYKTLPSDVPGLGALDKRRSILRQSTGRLQFSPAGTAGIQKAAIGKGSFILGNNIDDLLAYAKIRREALVSDSLEFVRRAYPQGNYYFIVNKGSKKWEGFVPLAANFISAAIFDPMNERKGLAELRANREVFLQLQPGESCVLQTFHSANQSPRYPYYHPAGNPLEIKGGWKIEFTDGGPRLPASTTLNQLGSWTKIGGEDVMRFSGTAKYSVSFSKPKGKAAAWLLDLGKVDVTAQVFLNGKKLASLIGPFFQMIIPAPEIRELNNLEIRVSSGMVNRIEDLDRQAVNWKKFYNYNFPAHLRENRNASGLFDASKWTPVDSGLSGPVTITPLKSK
ncbi:MAG TPA: glycosyl hydrolase [Puia sp.]|nr:glycosyl hydrolase [Puia sp.]